MTLKYMQGFESCRDDSDFRSQGWFATSTKLNVACVPSITAVAGESLQLLSNAAAGNSGGIGVAGSPDPGFFNTGMTTNQAWTAGGFTIGIAARFNSTINAAYGTTGPGWTNSSICFDGSKYWAWKVVGSTFTIATSPDLINWTPTPTTPPNPNSYANIAAMGGGIIAVVPNQVTASVPVYYSSDGGTTWNTQVIYTAGAPVGGSAGTAIATGDATNPHAFVIGNNGGGTSGGMFVGTIGGTFTKVVSAAASQVLAGRIKLIGSLLIYSAPNELYCATGTGFLTGTKATYTAGAGGMDITYLSSSNLFIICGNNGIYTFPNTGASGTPVAPSGAVTTTVRYNTAAINNVFTVGSVAVGIGNAGHIVTSTDGITWVEQGSHIIPVGTSGTDWQSAIYDGSRYILTSDPTRGVLAVTPDLQTNYRAIYVSDKTEAAVGSNGVMGAFGASPFGSGTFTANTTSGLVAAAPSGGTRTITFYANGANLGTFNVLTTPATHYYEIKYAKVAGSGNTFTATVWVDSVQVFGPTSAFTLASSTADTTSVLGLGLGRNGSFVAWDDIYVTLDDGVANTAQGPLGVVNIVARRPTTNSAVQWVKSGAAATNALSVNQSAISSLSTNAVTSANAADRDTYTSTDTLPSGYTAKVVSVEGYFARTSAATPTVNIGVVSGSTEVDSAAANITLATPTYVSTIIERDPNGNAAWTNSSVIASQIALNHTA